VTKADAVAAILWIGVTFYAVFGGADFGAGLWDLLAGRGESAEAVRGRINHSLAPVWEANHVWLIFALVVLWTGFPDAFAAVMTTLYLPLALAALGIVLRGSGFAFRKVVTATRWRRDAGLAFSLSSVLTPFFMGTVVGGIADGRVPAEGNGDAISSWTGPLSIAIGVLFVAAGAYLAAVFLVIDSRRSGDERLERYFTQRAIAAATIAGAAAIAGLIVLHADARELYDALTDEGLPLVIVSVACGIAALAMLLRRALRGVRVMAVTAVIAVIWGWGAAQYPDLLPGELTIEAGAGASSALTGLLVVFGVAIVLVIPALAFLYWLSQRSLLED
jgi:cytochrome bd ubiquinol oxidase subunit II